MGLSEKANRDKATKMADKVQREAYAAEKAGDHAKAKKLYDKAEEISDMWFTL